MSDGAELLRQTNARLADELTEAESRGRARSETTGQIIDRLVDSQAREVVLVEALTRLTDEVSRYLLAEYPNWLEAGTPAVKLAQVNVDIGRAALAGVVEAEPRDCGFCHGEPVQNAASWTDGKPRPPAACPRCGVVAVSTPPDGRSTE